VIVACAPLDQHELGALMLAVMLRRRGYRVTYVGANTPVADLAAMARDTRPLALMISASTHESLSELRARRDLLTSAAPMVVFGGAVFNHDPAAAEELGGHYLAAGVVSAVDRFDELVRSREVEVA